MADREDLLRVDATGTVHPVGRRASQRLRARAGEWEIAPSADDVIVLRRSNSRVEAVMKLAGEIRSPGAICDVVSLVGQSQWTGELVVIEEESQRSIFFDTGSVIGANTNVPEERLGETLYRFGVVTREQLDGAIQSHAVSGKRLGEAAIALEYVNAEDLFPMMTRQVEEVFYAATRVSIGMFYFFDRFDESHIPRRHTMNAGALIMEGARRMDEMQYFRQKVPNENFIPTPTRANGIPPDHLVEVFAACDGKRTVAEIGRMIGELEFEVTREVFQLVSGGLVQMIAPRIKGPVAIVEGFNPALVNIHARCDSLGKGNELREGLGRFATGGGIYDPLFQGAGPQSDGSFKAERLARNLAALAGDDPDAWLIQLLHEYVGFALFQAGSLLPRVVELELQNDVAAQLKSLKPVESAPLASWRP